MKFITYGSYFILAAGLIVITESADQKDNGRKSLSMFIKSGLAAEKKTVRNLLNTTLALLKDQQYATLTNLKNEVKDVIKDRSKLSNQLQDMQSDIDHMDSSIDSLQTAVEGLGDETHLLQGHLEKSVIEIGNRIKELEKQMLSVQQKVIDALHPKLSQLVTMGNVKRPSCPGPWTRLLDICIFIGPHKKTWSDAYDSCKGIGGRLAELSRDTYNTMVLMLEPGSEFWLGADDRSYEGYWKWSTSRLELSSYDNRWWGREPNNDGNEDCLELRVPGFNDENCSIKNKFICEKQLE